MAATKHKTRTRTLCRVDRMTGIDVDVESRQETQTALCVTTAGRESRFHYEHPTFRAKRRMALVVTSTGTEDRSAQASAATGWVHGER